jgi:hypothetical protein
VRIGCGHFLVSLPTDRQTVLALSRSARWLLVKLVACWLLVLENIINPVFRIGRVQVARDAGQIFGAGIKPSLGWKSLLQRAADQVGQHIAALLVGLAHVCRRKLDAAQGGVDIRVLDRLEDDFEVEQRTVRLFECQLMLGLASDAAGPGSYIGSKPTPPTLDRRSPQILIGVANLKMAMHPVANEPSVAARAFRHFAGQCQLVKEVHIRLARTDRTMQEPHPVNPVAHEGVSDRPGRAVFADIDLVDLRLPVKLEDCGVDTHGATLPRPGRAAMAGAPNPPTLHPVNVAVDRARKSLNTENRTGVRSHSRRSRFRGRPRPCCAAPLTGHPPDGLRQGAGRAALP